jgi:hypothetical protein
MPFATIDELRSHLGGSLTPEYSAKMMHAVPVTTVVDRTAFILERVKGKRVLEFGASGKLHEGIVNTAAVAHGVDRESSEDGIVEGFDLDDPRQDALPVSPKPPQIIVCGETLEHLSNPGWFVRRLKAQYCGVPVIFTVPNAFGDILRTHMKGGIENVNRDHVCYYSYTTLKTLLERNGYHIAAFHWYNGQPLFAEGLIMVAV